MNKKIDEYKTLMIIVAITGMIAIVIGLFFYKERLAWVKGVLFGTFFTIFRIMLMQNTFNKAVMMSAEAAKKYTVVHYSIRYVLTGIVLVVALTEPSISFLGTCIGIFSMKIATYSLLLFIGKMDKA